MNFPVDMSNVCISCVCVYRSEGTKTVEVPSRCIALYDICIYTSAFVQLFSFYVILCCNIVYAVLSSSNTHTYIYTHIYIYNMCHSTLWWEHLEIIIFHLPVYYLLIIHHVDFIPTPFRIASVDSGTLSNQHYLILLSRKGIFKATL